MGCGAGWEARAKESQTEECADGRDASRGQRVAEPAEQRAADGAKTGRRQRNAGEEKQWMVRKQGARLTDASKAASDRA